MNVRTAAGALLGVRVAVGAVLFAAPTIVSAPWLGPSAGTAPTQVPVQALGAREILIHGGGLLALRAGQPLRPFFGASMAGDLSDVVATIARRGGLPTGSPAATAIVAGGSALLSLAVAVALDE